MMVGRSIDQLFPKAEAKIGASAARIARCLACAKGYAMSPSPCVPARLSASRALSDRAAPRLALTIFGVTPATSGEILIDGQAGRHQIAAASARSRHRLCAGRPRPAGPDPAADHRREHIAHRARKLARCFHRRSRQGGCARPRFHQAIRHQGARAGAGRRASSPAATSRRSCSPNGLPPSRASSSWTSRRAASMSAPRRRSMR